jgi:transcriptional regulator with XRE-family HTH domain
MKVRLDRCAPAEPHGGTLWLRIGRRLQRRRAELGLTVNEVARALAIAPRAYRALEEGSERVPASLLGQVAELFRVRVFFFFQDIDFADESASDVAASPHGAYRVATLEERMEFLADSFRKLDLEGQQHLLALASALSRTSGKGET